MNDRKGALAYLDSSEMDRLRVAFVQEGIPPEFLSHYIPTRPFAFHSISDWLSD